MDGRIWVGRTAKHILNIEMHQGEGTPTESFWSFTDRQLNLQLLRVFPEEDHIWAEVFDHPLGGIYSPLNEITQTISEKIDLFLTHKEYERLTSFDRVNPDAYQAYLRGKFHAEKLSYEALTISMEYLEKAIAIDPSFAPAYASLALSLMAQVQMGLISPPKAMPKIYQSIHKSLSLGGYKLVGTWTSNARPGYALYIHHA